LSSEKKSPIEKAATLIRELEMRELPDVEKYEKCETIARLAPQEVVDLIDDSQVKEGVTWLKEAHKNIPSIAKWRKAFAQTIQLFFKEVGGIDRVKKWHELEDTCEKISEKELEDVNESLKEVIKWIQDVHDNPPERRAEIMRKIGSEIG